MAEKLPAWLSKQLDDIDLAKTKGMLEQASQRHAVSARFDARKQLIEIDLDNGARLSFPPQLAQGLEAAPAAALKKLELSPLGTSLYWPVLNVDLSVDGLVHGIFGSQAWQKAQAAKAGSARSEAKAQAARANGLKGGRPKKSQTTQT